MKFGKFDFDFEKKTYVMGIMNVTPDSFSDGGRFNQIDQALYHAERLVRDGADILDIGGESTRPGSGFVSQDEELNRVLPIIEQISREMDIPISIDTYKSEVAKQSLRAGAHIINDVWGAKWDPLMAEVAAEYEAPIILMHNRKETGYKDFIQDVITDLLGSIEIAKNAGVHSNKIILDPGIGFAKTFQQNVFLMKNLDNITNLGYPVLLGTSRKSMIGNILDLPVEERLEGTIASNCFGIQMGCRIVRVHDVKEMVRAAKVMDAILRAN
ncbi:MAG: dihydropteroate synthase [Bacillales bacterium]|jgi:dihydropteroate synthase|nr:dihydropteroate synthase [Bacillales bacterium]